MKMILAANNNNNNTGGATKKEEAEMVGNHDIIQKKPRFEIRHCNNCKQKSYHDDEDFFELEKNKGKRPDYWKTRLKK